MKIVKSVDLINGVIEYWTLGEYLEIIKENRG